MKKILLSATLLIAILSIVGYSLNRDYLTDLAARAFVSESVHDLIPRRILGRMNAITKPIGHGTEAFLQEMHNAGITIDQIIAVVDNTSEQEAYELLDAINAAKPKTTDDVFNIMQEHLTTGFDSEVFRQAFNNHVTMKQVQKALFYANQNRKTHDVEFPTAKAIMKQLLLEKERAIKELKKDEK